MTTRREQQTATGVLHTVFNTLHPRSASPDDWARRLLLQVRDEFWPDAAEPLTNANLSACADTMRAIADQFGGEP